MTTTSIEDEPNPFQRLKHEVARLTPNARDTTSKIVDHAVGLRLAIALSDPQRARNELESLRLIVNSWPIPDTLRAW